MRNRSFSKLFTSGALLLVLGALPVLAGVNSPAAPDRGTVTEKFSIYMTRNGYSNDGAYRPRFAPFSTLFSNLIGDRGGPRNGFDSIETVTPKSPETRNLGVGGCWGWRGCRISR